MYFCVTRRNWECRPSFTVSSAQRFNDVYFQCMFRWYCSCVHKLRQLPRVCAHIKSLKRHQCVCCACICVFHCTRLLIAEKSNEKREREKQSTQFQQTQESKVIAVFGLSNDTQSMKIEARERDSSWFFWIFLFFFLHVFLFVFFL